ncbi:MAG: hypothetical protein IKS19_05430 [Clostridia bacterium]|nr:hypothetical protein [Clostridia bacterium]
MKVLKKALSILLVLAMTVAVAACGDTSWVYKYNDYTVTSGVYLAFLINTYNEVVSNDQDYDTSKNIFSQTLSDGSDPAVKMTENAENYIKQSLYAKDALEKLGVELNDAFYMTPDIQTNYYWQMMQKNYSDNGVGQNSYKEYNRLASHVQSYFEKLYGEGGEKEVPVSDLLDFYKENYYAFKLISAQFADENGDLDYNMIDALNSTIQDRYNSYADDINSGTDFDSILAQENELKGNTSENSTNSQEPTIISKYDIATNYSEDFAIAVDELQPGKATALAVNNSYVLVQRVELDATEGADGFSKNKVGVLGYLKGEEYMTWLEEQAKSIELKVNEGAVKFYSPKNIKLSK